MRFVVEGYGVFGFMINAVVVKLIAFGGDARCDVRFRSMAFNPVVGNGAG